MDAARGRRRGILWGTLVVLLLGGGLFVARRALRSPPDHVEIGDCKHELDPEAAEFVDGVSRDHGELTYGQHLQMSSWGDGPGFFTWGPIYGPTAFVLRQGGTVGTVTVTVTGPTGKGRVLTYCNGEWIRSVSSWSDREMPVELRAPTGGATVRAGAKAMLRPRP
jgi:hypothetical protein